MTAISLDLSKKPELVWLSRLVADVQVVAREHDLLLHDARALLEASATATNTVPFYDGLVKREASAATESMLLGDMRSADPALDLRLLRSFAEGFEA